MVIVGMCLAISEAVPFLALRTFVDIMICLFWLAMVKKKKKKKGRREGGREDGKEKGRKENKIERKDRTYRNDDRLLWKIRFIKKICLKILSIFFTGGD